MRTFTKQIVTFFEHQTFGVCAWWGEKLGIERANIRLFFIYASFLAVGSPVILYLLMAFVLRVRNSFRSRRSSVWDL